MKIQLASDWKRLHKMYETWLAGLSVSTGALSMSWANLPDSWRGGLPHWVPTALGWIAVGCAFLVPPARAIRQGGSNES